MKYTLIVPPIYETELTGFAMAAEKTIGKSLWRLEMHTKECCPRVFKNGERVTVSELNGMPTKFIVSFLDFFLSSSKFAR